MYSPRDSPGIHPIISRNLQWSFQEFFQGFHQIFFFSIIISECYGKAFEKKSGGNVEYASGGVAEETPGDNAAEVHEKIRQ